jgi:hypothetical protein
MMVTRARQACRNHQDETSSDMTSFNITLPASIPFMDRLSGVHATLSDKMAKRKVFLTTLRELQSLSNRDLADLGLSRAALRGIAMEAAYGK